MTALDSIREYCLSLPDTTEGIQWEDVLLFRVGGKIFVMLNLNPAAEDRIAFKCAPEAFAELLERDGARPAAYVGRFKWIGLRDFNVLPAAELRELIRASYELIAAKLPKKKPAARRARRRGR
ncbi:MAG TPA: MmcQ/YjbR family DNA-binding protein [Terriglobales bacterium]|nr:MmcQ/YjbR family DNA-binding protein [Terriglobales bacterium]